MNQPLSAPPIWVGLAFRLADGTLYAVEMDGHIEAQLDVEYDYGDPSFFSTYRMDSPVMHVTARIEGIGKQVARFGEDMGDGLSASRD